MNSVKLNTAGDIPPEYSQEILSRCIHSDANQAEAAPHWLAFIYHLARRLNFLDQQGPVLKLKTQTVRNWLQKSAWVQQRQLQDTWRSDPTWNDLWHIPGLQPKKTGWENSPLLGRSKILSYLAQLPPDEWFSLDQFSQAIKKTEPDFQRPNGDYQSWYIYDADGKALMGFEHWEAIEGGVITYILTTILSGLGVVDLGAQAEGVSPTTFRITPLGQAFCRPDVPAPEPKPDYMPVLRINATNFTVRSLTEASLYDRFQLARFAQLSHREERRVTYKITRESYHQALEQGITLEQILAFLRRATRAQVPLALLETMRTWDRRTDSVKLEQLTILRVSRADMISELRNHPQIGPLLDQPFGAQAILIPEKHVNQVQKLLVEFGYLDEKQSPPKVE